MSQKQPNNEEQLRLFREFLRERAIGLDRLRRRAGLSMNALAKAMGFSGPSSIQRYLDPNYDKFFRPEILRAFKVALVGKGSPPITAGEIDALDLDSESPTDAEFIDSQLIRYAEALSKAKTLGTRDGASHMSATLPLIEGDVRIELPYFISEKSLKALQTWFEHILDLAQSHKAISEASQERLAESLKHTVRKTRK